MLLAQDHVRARQSSWQTIFSSMIYCGPDNPTLA